MRAVALTGVMSVLLAACAIGETTADTEPPTSSTAAPATTTTEAAATTTTVPEATTTTQGMDHSMDEADPADIAAATLGSADFQDVAVAEAAGWGSSMEALGCFENPGVGGMGLHYLNADLLDDQVDVGQPEALVYELDADAEIVGLVGHEYLVPFEAWTAEEPPTLFGLDFHEHPTLPFWILHAWVWKDNPLGIFNDWNPKVRMCPDGVPIFGVDLP